MSSYVKSWCADGTTSILGRRRESDVSSGLSTVYNSGSMWGPGLRCLSCSFLKKKEIERGICVSCKVVTLIPLYVKTNNHYCCYWRTVRYAQKKLDYSQPYKSKRIQTVLSRSFPGVVTNLSLFVTSMVDTILYTVCFIGKLSLTTETTRKNWTKQNRDHYDVGIPVDVCQTRKSSIFPVRVYFNTPYTHIYVYRWIIPVTTWINSWLLIFDPYRKLVVTVFVG